MPGVVLGAGQRDRAGLELGGAAAGPGEREPLADLAVPAAGEAGQRLVPDEQAGRELADRLGDDEQPVLGEHLLHLGGRGARVRARHLLVVGVHPAAAVRLGPVHGEVRLVQQRLQPDGAAADRAAAAHRGRDRAAADADGAGHGVGHPLQHRLDRGRGRVRQEDAELVAAQAGHQVLGARGGPQPGRGHRQQLVARAVPEVVVDGLEVVEVEHGDAERAPAALRGLGQGPAAAHEQGPVGQPGQLVGVRHPAQVLLEPALGRPVAEAPHPPDDRAVDELRLGVAGEDAAVERARPRRWPPGRAGRRSRPRARGRRRGRRPGRPRARASGRPRRRRAPRRCPTSPRSGRCGRPRGRPGRRRGCRRPWTPASPRAATGTPRGGRAPRARCPGGPPGRPGRSATGAGAASTRACCAPSAAETPRLPPSVGPTDGIGRRRASHERRAQGQGRRLSRCGAGGPATRAGWPRCGAGASGASAPAGGPRRRRRPRAPPRAVEKVPVCHSTTTATLPASDGRA